MNVSVEESVTLGQMSNVMYVLKWVAETRVE
jgi:hypothetical protein